MGAPVLIVGAGPTGLVLALWLTRMGVAVRIIDRLAEAGATSRALAVQVRTLELYRQVGLADAPVAGGVKVPAVNLWVKGDRAARVPLDRLGEGRTPFPFVLVYPQDAHERLLIDELAALGVAVERRTELVGLEAHAHGVRATLRGPGGEEACEAAYLAGCDGAGSTVRESLGVGFPGGTYAAMFYVADVDATGPATNCELHVDLGDADFLIVFPLKEAGRVRLVGTVRTGAGGGDAHREPTFDDVGGRAMEHLKLDVKRVHWFSTYHVHHRVAHRFRRGRVFLLGDAAHIHSPVGGQGMNTGIGDAVNLAWKLAAVLRGGASGRLLDTYEPERIAFARRLVATTDRVFTVVTRRGRLARLVRTRVVPMLMPPLLRLGPMRRFLFRSVSQIGIRYRASDLSAGSAGGVRGGDRLPWTPLASGGDNFDPLTSLDWQVHVYGPGPADLAEACDDLGLVLHRFDWEPAMGRAGLVRGALYLIRPDGYIALADADGDPRVLHRYLDTHAELVRPGAAPPTPPAPPASATIAGRRAAPAHA